MVLTFGLPFAIIALTPPVGIGPFSFWGPYLAVSVGLSLLAIWGVADGGSFWLSRPWGLTLSPDALRAEWWSRSFTFPWGSLKSARRRVESGTKGVYISWELQFQVPGRQKPRTLRIAEEFAPSVLKYPSCPRVSLTPKEVSLLNNPPKKPLLP